MESRDADFKRPNLLSLRISKNVENFDRELEYVKIREIENSGTKI